MQIYNSINAVMNDIGAIGKEKKNQQQGFMYRGIDDVMNALQPLLIKHKIFVCPEVLDQIREERTNKSGGTLLYSILKMKYTFFATDGSNITAITVGEGMDSGDKASNKAMAIAFKYACFQVFCIPTEEMKDPDADSPPPSNKKEESMPVKLPTASTVTVTKKSYSDNFKCVVCGKEVNQEIAEGSKRGYGKVFCSKECKEKGAIL